MENDKSRYRELFTGVDYEVEREDGKKFIPINFDNAATTPALKIVTENINTHLNMYGSIGRGAGIKSSQTTEIFRHSSRETVLNFFDLKDTDGYSVVYVKNTTEGMNLLASALIESKEDKILATRMEHHANDLPWRKCGKVLYLETDEDGKLILDNLEEILKSNDIKVVTVTGASNVTGYINPINKIAKIAHENNALMVVDAAQLVAHKKINILGEKGNNDYLDFIVFSGHKMYAPFGSGVIVGRMDQIKNKDPFLRGGGVVDMVFDNEVYWDDTFMRYEAGTQNYFGTIGIISAMQKLKQIGLENIENYEDKMKNYLFKEIDKIPNIIKYGAAKCDDRISLLSINVKDKDHDIVAKELSDLREIAVRDGCFCAHCYVKRLLGLEDQETKKYLYDKNLKKPGLVRISLGLYNDINEIDEFLNVLDYIAENKNKIIY